MSGRYLMLSVLVALLWACGESVPSAKKLPEVGQVVYINAQIYTGEGPTWAESMVIDAERILFVGTKQEALSRYENAKVIDLAGLTVFPGMIDTHTHPGLVAIMSYDDLGKDEQPMPAQPKAEILTWLDDHINNNWWKPYIEAGEWDVEQFLPEGPHKSDLDSVSSWRPIVLFDNSAHSFWLNSSALSLLGIDKNTQDLSPVSYFVRDDNGEPTGWVKEFALLPYVGDWLLPSENVMKKKLLKFLTFLASKGITSLYDAGNFSYHHNVYELVAQLDKANLLPLRYEGTYHIYSEAQLDIAVQELIQMRHLYGSERLTFNTMKIHYDGVFEVLTGALSEPYATDPQSNGDVIFTTDRLMEFILELEKNKIDLHMHTVGDRAVKNVLDAVERVQNQLKQKLAIAITLTHLEYVEVDDIARIKDLGIHANFTPHWFGGGAYGSAGDHNLGEERASQKMVLGHFVDAGVNTTLSSDVVSVGEAYRANPFIGVEMSVTRKEFGDDEAGEIYPPADAVITLDEAIRGYTISGAKQLKRQHDIGSLTSGKLADFIVLNKNPFSVKENQLHTVEPVATYVGGRLVAGALP